MRKDLFAKGAIVPKSAIITSKKQDDLTKIKGNMTETNTTCALIPDCCITVEWGFKCPAHKSVESCQSNLSDGAWVPYSVAYEEAYSLCQAIKADSATGTNKQFTVAFSTSFK
jgi:hypothetical protein